MDDRNNVVGAEGFEPPTSSSQSWRSTRLSYTPTSGQRHRSRRQWYVRAIARVNASGHGDGCRFRNEEADGKQPSASH